MKTSLLRQAAVSRVAFAARPARMPFRASLAIRAAAPVHRPVSSLLRFYSSESAVPESAVEHQEPVTRFEDLPRLGVHERIVRSITKGMKYENMTDVQSMTVNSALAGKDV